MRELTLYRWVQGWHLNTSGIMFGGQMLSWVDEDTTLLAHEACRPGCRLTTGGYERVSFVEPCQLGDRLVFKYSVVHVGTKSMTILADVRRRPRVEHDYKGGRHPEFRAFESLTAMICLSGPLSEWLDGPPPEAGEMHALVERLKKERKPLHTS